MVSRRVIASGTFPSPHPLPAPVRAKLVQRAGRGMNGEGMHILCNVRFIRHSKPCRKTLEASLTKLCPIWDKVSQELQFGSFRRIPGGTLAGGWLRCAERSKRLARQALVCLEVFVPGFGDDIFREFWRGRSFVPIQRFEVITDELFVEAWLAAAGLVLVRGPEPGRVGSQHFVNEDQLPFVNSEFELGVGNNDPALAG